MKITWKKVLLLALFVLVLTALFVVGASATVTDDLVEGTSVASYTDNATNTLKYTDSLSEAITNAKEGSTITLLKEVNTGADKFTVNKTLTIDGNATAKNTITSSAADPLFTVSAGFTLQNVNVEGVAVLADVSGSGALNITNSTVTGTGRVIRFNTYTGIATISGSTINGSGDSIIFVNNTGVSNFDLNVVNNSHLNGTASTRPIWRWANGNGSNVDITITDSTLTSASSIGVILEGGTTGAFNMTRSTLNAASFGLQIQAASAQVTLDDVDITSPSWAVTFQANDINVEIKGGSNIVSTGCNAIGFWNPGTLTVTGSTLESKATTATQSDANYRAAIWAQGRTPTINISGATNLIGEKTITAAASATVKFSGYTGEKFIVNADGTWTLYDSWADIPSGTAVSSIRTYSETLANSVPAGYIKNTNTDDGTYYTFLEPVAEADAVAYIMVGSTKVFYKTLADALSAAEANDVIVLLKDVTLDSSLAVSKSVTIDGGETTQFSITSTVVSAIKVSGGVNFTLQNAKLNGADRTFHISGAGSATIENSTLTGSGWFVYAEASTGSLTIIGSTLNSTGGTILMHNCPSFALTVTGGSILNLDGENAGIWVSGGNVTSITVEDSELKGVKGISHDNTAVGTITVDGVTFEVTGGAITKSRGNAASQINISGNTTVTGSNTLIGYAPTAISLNGYTAENFVVIGDSAYSVYDSIGAAVDADNALNTIRTYNDTAANAAVAAGYTKSEKTADGYYTFTVASSAENAVASIEKDGTTNYYATLSDALQAAVDGDTVVLLKEVTNLADAAVNASITIDGEGLTITSSGSITVATDKNLTLENVTVSCKQINIQGGDLTLDGATLDATGKGILGTVKNLVLKNASKAESDVHAIEVNCTGTIDISNSTLIATYEGMIVTDGGWTTISVTGSTVNAGRYGLQIAGTGEVTVDNTAIDGATNALRLTSCTKVTVKNCDSIKAGTALLLTSCATVEITNVTVTATGHALQIETAVSAVTVSNSTLKGGATNFTIVYRVSVESSLTVQNTTIESTAATPTDGYLIWVPNAGGHVTFSGNVTLTGGKVGVYSANAVTIADNYTGPAFVVINGNLHYFYATRDAALDAGATIDKIRVYSATKPTAPEGYYVQQTSDSTGTYYVFMEGVSAEDAVASITKGGATNYYASLGDALKAAVDGDVIVLKKDAELGAVTIDKALTIQSAEGQKYTITGTGSPLFTVNANFTLKNVKVGGAAISVYTAHVATEDVKLTINIENCELNGSTKPIHVTGTYVVVNVTAGSVLTGSWGVHIQANSSVLNLDNSTIDVTGHGICVQNGGDTNEVKITNGAKVKSSGATAIIIQKAIKLTIDGSGNSQVMTEVSTSGSNAIAIDLKGGTINITNAALTSTSGRCYVAQAGSNTVFRNATLNAGTASINTNPAAVITLSGSTTLSSGTNDIAGPTAVIVAADYSGPAFAVISGTNYNYYATLADATEAGATIDKIRIYSAEAPVIDGYEVTQHADGYYTLSEAAATPVAKIGDKGYPTLEAALEAANAGDTIVLLKNVTTTAITVSKSVKIDGQNKAYTIEFTDTGYMFTVSAGVTFEINGVILKHSTTGSGLNLAANTTVTVENCDITTSGTSVLANSVSGVTLSFKDTTITTTASHTFQLDYNTDCSFTLDKCTLNVTNSGNAAILFRSPTNSSLVIKNGTKITAANTIFNMSKVRKTANVPTNSTVEINNSTLESLGDTFAILLQDCDKDCNVKITNNSTLIGHKVTTLGIWGANHSTIEIDKTVIKLYVKDGAPNNNLDTGSVIAIPHSPAAKIYLKDGTKFVVDTSKATESLSWVAISSAQKTATVYLSGNVTFEGATGNDINNLSNVVFAEDYAGPAFVFVEGSNYKFFTTLQSAIDGDVAYSALRVYGDDAKEEAENAGYIATLQAGGYYTLFRPVSADEAAASITKGGTTNYYATLADALSAAADNDVIVLLKDVTLTSVLTVNKSVIIDGTKGTDEKWTINGSVEKAITVSGDIEFTLQNVNYVATANHGFYVTGAAKATLDNCTVTGSGRVLCAHGATGSLTVNNSTICDGEANNGTILIWDCSGSTFVLTVKGSTLDLGESTTGVIWTSGGSVSSIIVENSTLKGVRGIWHDNTAVGTITVDGVTFEVTGGAITLGRGSAASQINVRGNTTVTGTDALIAYATTAVSFNGYTAETFIVIGSSGYTVFNSWADVVDSGISLKGIRTYSATAAGTVPTEDFIKEQKTDDGTYYVITEIITPEKAQASITIGNETTYYKTLAEAISEAPAGATVVILKDITLNSTISVNKEITVDGANHQITAIATVYEIVSGAKLTLVGGNYRTSGDLAVLTVVNGELNIESGYYYTNSKYALGVLVATHGTVNINGGTFELDNTTNAVDAVIVADTTATINVIGGAYIAADGVDALFREFAHTAVLNVNFVVRIDGVNYAYTTFADAYAAATAVDSATIVLYQNITIDATIEINNDITIEGNGFSIMASDIFATFTIGTDGKLALNDVSVNSPILAGNALNNVTVNTVALKQQLESELYVLSDADANGNYTVIGKNELEGEAQIGNTLYDTLTEALNAAAPGDTILLLTDVTLTQTLTIDKAIVLDLGGKILTANVAVKAPLTVQNGKIVASGTAFTLDTGMTLALTGVIVEGEDLLAGDDIIGKVTFTHTGLLPLIYREGYAADLDEGVYTVAKAAVSVDGSNYKTFLDAWTNAADGSTITLLDDVTITGTILVDKSVTIDGDGHKITTNYNNYLFNFRTTAATTTFKLMDVDVAHQHMVANVDGGYCAHITIEDATFTGVTDLGLQHFVYFRANSSGSLTVKNVTAENIRSTAISVFGTNAVSITDSTIKGAGKGIEIGGTSTLSITDSTIDATSHAVQIENMKGTAVIESSIIKSVVQNYAIVYRAGDANTSLTIKDSTVENNFTGSGDGVAVWAPNRQGTLILSGESTLSGKMDIMSAIVPTFASDYAGPAFLLRNSTVYNLYDSLADIDADATVTLLRNVTLDATAQISHAITLNGNGFTLTANGFAAFTMMEGGTLVLNDVDVAGTVLAGKVNGNVTTNSATLATKLNDEHYVCVSGGGVYTVYSSVATIVRNGVTTNYATFAEAIAAAIDGDTVILNANVTIDETITKSISIVSHTTGDYTFTSTAAVAFEVRGTVEFDLEAILADGTAFLLYEGAAITLNDTFVQAGEILRGFANSNTVTFTNDALVPVLSVTYAISGDDVYTVRLGVAKVNGKGYATLAEAIAAAEDGDVILLLADVTLNTTISINKDLTINGSVYQIIAATAVFEVVEGAALNLTGGLYRSSGEAVIVVNGGTLNVAGGYYYANGENVRGVLVANGGTVTIRGGVFELASSSDAASEAVIVANGDAVVNVIGGTYLAPDDADTIFDKANDSAELNEKAYIAKGAQYEELTVLNMPTLLDGVKIRLTLNGNKEGGLRFTATLSDSAYEALFEGAEPIGTYTDVGMLIVPLDKIGNTTILSHEILATLGLDVEDYVYSQANGTASAVNVTDALTIRVDLDAIAEKYYDCKYAAVAFVSYTVGAETYYLYSSFDAEKNACSLQQLAVDALNDISRYQTFVYRFPVLVGNKVCYSRYTADQRAMLSRLHNCNYTEIVLIAPKPFENGLMRVICDVCGSDYEQIIPMTDPEGFRAASQAKIGDDYHLYLSDALNAAKDGDVITLLKDISLDSTALVGKSVTIEGNFTVTSTADAAFTVTSGKTLTVNDLSIEAEFAFALRDGAVAKLAQTVELVGTTAMIDGNCDTTQDGGYTQIKLVAASINSTKYDTLQDAIDAAVAGDVIKLENDLYVSENGLAIDKAINLDCNGFAIYSVGSGEAMIIFGSEEIYGDSTITGAVDEAAYLTVNEGKVTLTLCGTFTGAINNAGAGATIVLLANINVASTITVDKELTIDGMGNTITASTTLFTVNTNLTLKNLTASTTSSQKLVAKVGTHTVNITNCALSSAGNVIHCGNAATFVITDSQLISSGATVFNVSESVNITLSGDTTVSGSAQAEDIYFDKGVGNFFYTEDYTGPAFLIIKQSGRGYAYNFYASFDEALAAVAEGGTIKMLADLEINSTMTFNSKSVVIDGYGHKIIFANNTAPVFSVAGGKTLTVTNTEFVIAGGTAFTAAEGATLNLGEGVTITAQNAWTIDATGGTANFEFDAIMTKNGNVYHFYNTLSDAIADTDEVILSGKVELTDKVVVNKDLTIIGNGINSEISFTGVALFEVGAFKLTLNGVKLNVLPADFFNPGVEGIAFKLTSADAEIELIDTLVDATTVICGYGDTVPNITTDSVEVATMIQNKTEPLDGDVRLYFVESNGTYTFSKVMNVVAVLKDADGEEIGRYATFEEAFDAAPEGATIELLANVAVFSPISVNKNLTIDGKGFGLSVSVGNLFNVKADLILKNLNASGVNGIVVSTAGVTVDVINSVLSVTETGILVEACEGTTINVNGTDITARTGIDLQVNNALNCTVNITNGSNITAINRVVTVHNYSNATDTIVVNIEDSTASSEAEYAIFMQNSGVLNISGSTITMTAPTSKNLPTIQVAHTRISITDSTVTTTSRCAVLMTHGGSLTVLDATLTSVNNVAVVTHTNTVITVKGNSVINGAEGFADIAYAGSALTFVDYTGPSYTKNGNSYYFN